MVRQMTRPSRIATALASALGFGLASGGTASAQAVFDPYIPYNYQYYAYTAPSVPNYLALPNAARRAGEYGAIGSGFGMSRSNAFGRWMDEYEAEISGRRTPPERGAASVEGRRYVPNREADRRFREEQDERTRRFVEQEQERDRIATERDRYYAAAIRTTDPNLRARYMRVVTNLSDPKTQREMLRAIEASRGETRRTEPAAGTSSAPGATSRAAAATKAATPGRAVAPNRTAPSTPATTPSSPSAAASPTPPAGTAPAASAGPIPVPSPATVPAPRASEPRRAPATVLPDARPPMPSERRTLPGDSAPLPRGAAPLPVPDPIPDDIAPAPPR
jgi:hypothetical protein